MKTNDILKSLAIILTCVVFNGCATGKLWQSYDSTKKEKLSATSNQIFYSCIDGNCDQQKLLLSYKLNQTGISLQNEHPPFEQGYIIINNKECIKSISDGMKNILNKSDLLKNALMKAKITKNIRPDGSIENYIEFYIIAKEAKHQINFEKININKRALQLKKADYSDFDEDGRVIPKGAMIISIGDSECKIHQGFMMADINFMGRLKFTSANDKWLPIKNAYPSKTMTIVFINQQTEKIYQKSLVERIVLTPFSIVADIIIAPIAFLTLPLWAPK